MKVCGVCGDVLGDQLRYCSRDCSYVGVASVRVLRGRRVRTASTVRVRDMIEMGRSLSDRVGEWVPGMALAETAGLSANRIASPLRVYMDPGFLEIGETDKGTKRYRARREARCLRDMVGDEITDKALAVFK